METNRLLCGAVLTALAGGFACTGVANAGPLHGAIFTTTVEGGYVNGNVIYDAKEDVYLDGGPGPNAPPTAAGLPAGDYYFQVTDPSGKDLLSSDHISCRKVRVNEHGVIDYVYEGTNYVWAGGGWTPVACRHAEGVDMDHDELGAITVQLYPYDDTPNPGGVYKAWMTPVEHFAGETAGPPDGAKKNGYTVNGEWWQPGNVHGFIPSWSKTDNYKVDRKGKPIDPPEITVRKFHDKDVDGYWDDGEEEVYGWSVQVNDPNSVSNTVYTPGLIVAEPSGTYQLTESTPAGTLQTVSIVDGYPVDPTSPTVNVMVDGYSGETHEVVYGNVGLGNIDACKVFDRNADGQPDEGEPGVPGWKFELTGVDITGAAVGPTVQVAGADGCTTFSDLLPGAYTVTELQPGTGTWFATGEASFDTTIESTLDGATMSGSMRDVAFTNACTAQADFGTKGYWHNKNGLAEMTDDDIAHVNTLAPYASPSSYFDAGDEPFDGYFTDGTPVESAYNNEDVAPMALAGTPRAEVSHFLVDTNQGADPREQLAQQLLAFIFNARNRLDGGPGSGIELPDGTWTSAQALIDEAIALWQGGSAYEQTALKDLLDAFNNSDAVNYVPASPCDVTYGY